jgi:tetratricopeptide (TPR) repeat protein
LAPLVICPLLVALVLRWIGYFFALRQMLFLLPFYLLLTSLGIAQIAGWLGRATQGRAWSGAAQAAAVLSLLALLLLPLRPAIASNLATPRQDWRAALEFVVANAAPEDAIATPGMPAHYFTYYASPAASRLSSPRTPQEIQALAGQAPAVWVVLAMQIGDLRSRLHAWLQQVNALTVPFGSDLTVYYWRPDAGEPSPLAESEHWQLPRNLAALEALVHFYEEAGWPEAAASAAAQGTALAASQEQASFFEMLRGSVWRERGDSLQAVAAFQEALALWPENAEALVRMGEQLLALRRDAEAAATLERAVTAAPDSYWAHRLLAEARERQGRMEAAIAAYRKAVAINPDEPETYALLGDVLVAAGDRAGAIAAYEQFIRRIPDGPRGAEVQRKLSELHSSP